MRWFGRAVALLFLVWLAVVLLGGLGFGPAERLPLGNVLRPTKGPPPLPRTLHPRGAAPADLVPAVPASVYHAATTSSRAARAASRAHSASAPGRTKTTVTTTRGKSGTAPGHVKTTTNGRSGTAPGQTVTKVTTTNSAGKIHVVGKKP